ncbi:MAG: hypothetical protein II710_03950 [Clostridia bacterium]|nr:hypothetical protein [Clostridia bacterium]
MQSLELKSIKPDRIDGSSYEFWLDESGTQKYIVSEGGQFFVNGHETIDVSNPFIPVFDFDGSEIEAGGAYIRDRMEKRGIETRVLDLQILSQIERVGINAKKLITVLLGKAIYPDFVNSDSTTFTYYINGDKDDPLVVDENGAVSDSIHIVFDSDLDSELKLSEAELRRKEQIGICKFLRAEAIRDGLIDENAPRIILTTEPYSEEAIIQQMTELFQPYHSVDEAVAAFMDQGIYPDLVYGSGTTLVEYWLDDEGHQALMIRKEGGGLYYLQDGEIVFYTQVS